MLVAVPGLVQAMPKSVLAAVIIAASISLFDVAGLRRLYEVRRSEFGLAVACGLGVAFVGVLQGIVIAVLLSVAYIFKRAWSPYSAVLGKAPGVHGYNDMRRYPDARPIPGLLMVRWSAPLFFANANEFRDRIRELVKATDPHPSGCWWQPSPSPTSTRPPGRCSGTSISSSTRAARGSPSRSSSRVSVT